MKDKRIAIVYLEGETFQVWSHTGQRLKEHEGTIEKEGVNLLHAMCPGAVLKVQKKSKVNPMGTPCVMCGRFIEAL